MRTIVMLALVVVAVLVGYTWLSTGEIGLWPDEPTAEEQELERLEERLAEVEARIRSIERQASVSPDSAMVAAGELEELEEERERLRELIDEQR